MLFSTPCCATPSLPDHYMLTFIAIIVLGGSGIDKTEKVCLGVLHHADWHSLLTSNLYFLHVFTMFSWNTFSLLANWYPDRLPLMSHDIEIRQDL